MYKNNITRKVNLFKGFTIAEILITLLIIGFVGVLTVPMLTRPRLKPQEVVQPHGTMECFWIGDRLYQYTANNTTNTQGITTEIKGNQCEFTPPTETFTIQAISGGGSANATESGTVSGDSLPSYNETVVKQESGEIRFDENFQIDITKAPDWVRNSWSLINHTNPPFFQNDKNRLMKYELYSPIGAGGKGVTTRFLKDGTECQSSKPPMDCFDFKYKKGGNSEKGFKLNLWTFITPKHKVEYDIDLDHTQLSIRDKDTNELLYSIKLIASNAGTDALAMQKAPEGTTLPGKSKNYLPNSPQPKTMQGQIPNKKATPRTTNSSVLHDDTTNYGPGLNIPTDDFSNWEDVSTDMDTGLIHKPDNGGFEFNDPKEPGNSNNEDKKDEIENIKIPDDKKNKIIIIDNNKITTIISNFADTHSNNGGSNGNNSDRKPASIGSINADKYNYSRDVRAVEAKYVSAGGVGRYKIKTISKWPSEHTLYLQPGKAGQPTNVKAYNTNNALYDFIPTAESGETGMLKSITIAIEDEEDLPFPKQEMKKIIPETPSISIADGIGYTSKLKQILDKNPEFIPGKGGYGSYPFIAQLENKYYQDGKEFKTVYGILGRKGEEIQIWDQLFKKIISEERDCINGFEQEYNDKQQLYCRGKKRVGTGGAVIITW